MVNLEAPHSKDHQINLQLVKPTSERKAYKPGIGGLGEPQYQPESLRIKSFCGEIIETPEQYLQYVETTLFPAVEANPDVTRIIDRVLVRDGVQLPFQGMKYDLYTEASIRLGGRWEGYRWAMNGASMPGRELSLSTKTALIEQLMDAKEQKYTPPQDLPPGFKMEKLDGKTISEQDTVDLAEIFKLAFKNYLSPMTTPEQVFAWANGENIYPVVVRNEAGHIVVVANGDIATMRFPDAEFRFFEIGDSAGHPDYRKQGINRYIKHFLLSEAAKMDFDSIHTETRAAWKSPNFGNAKNGMLCYGTLWLNCQIGGPEDVPESSDPNISPESRRMGSLNIWAMTPNNPLWEHYQTYIEPNL